MNTFQNLAPAATLHTEKSAEYFKAYNTNTNLSSHKSFFKPLITTIRKFNDSLSFMDLPVFKYIDREDFAIVKIEELGMQIPYQTPVFRPDHFSIIIVPDGNATYRVDDKVFEVNQNSILFIQPDAFVSSKWMSINKAYNISFNNSFLAQYWPAGIDEIRKLDANKGYATKLTKEKMENFECICLNIYDEAISSAPYKHEIIANMILNLLILIRQQQHKDVPLCPKEKYNSYVAAFLKDVEDNFSRIASGEDITLMRVKDYANNQNLSELYLSKIVSSTTKKTANQYIHDKLINEIKYLLKYTDKPMKDIAAIYGFNDLNYFYNYFKKHTQNAPGTFRKDFNIPGINKTNAAYINQII